MSPSRTYITSLKNLLFANLERRGSSTRECELSWLVLFDLVKRADIASITREKALSHLRDQVLPPTSTAGHIATEHEWNLAMVRVEDFLKNNSTGEADILLQGYVLALKAKDCSASTIKNYLSDIRQILAFASGATVAATFTETRLLEFARGQERVGLAGNTIRRKLTTAAQFAKWLTEQGALEAQVAQKLSNLAISYGQTGNLKSAAGLTSLPQIPDAIVHTPVAETTSGEVKVDPNQAHNRVVNPSPITAQDSVQAKNGTHNYGTGATSTTAPQDTAKSRLLGKPNLESDEKLQEVIDAAVDKRLSNTPTHQKPRVTFQTAFTSLALVLSVLGFGLFAKAQLFDNADPSLAYPTALTRPNRTLSFQGRLTDSATNPVTAPTDMAFRLYDTGPGTGGIELWNSGTCSVTPDQDGIFSVGLGDECGAEISGDAFSENNAVWLEVEIESETLEPRQSIKAVAYALNAETLQGYPASASATESTVVVMNEYGQIMLGNASPIIRATSSNGLTLDGLTLNLTTTPGSNGNVVLDPDGLGQVLVQSNLGVSGAATVSGNLTTLSDLAAGDDLIVAGDSDVGGYATVGASLAVGYNNAPAGPGGGIFSGRVGIGTSSPSDTLHVAGSLRVTGALKDASNSVGSAGYILSSTGTATSWIDPVALVEGTNYWNLVGGAVFTKNSTVDLLLGGSATTSADFAFMNVNSGTPTASISGNLAIASPTGANPATTYSILNGGSFNLRTSVGGDAGATSRLFVNNAGNVGVGSTTPGTTLDVVGTGRFSSSLTAGNGFTLTTGALNLTATSGTISLSGMSASSMNFGANNLLVTAGNFNTTSTGINTTAIGATTPSTAAFTTLAANSTVTLTGLGTGTDNTVLILNASNQVTTDEINSKVWDTGITLVDGTGTANRVAYWTGTGTIAADDDLYFDGTNVGIGTTSVGSYRLNVNGNVNLASGFDYHINGVGLNDNTSGASGASLIGLYDDSMTYIGGNTTVQSAIKQLDTNMGTLAAGTSKWTRVAGNLYPTLGESISATTSGGTVGTFTSTGTNNALIAGSASNYFTVSNVGGITVPGAAVFSNTLTSSGGAISLNHNSNFTVNIGTGTTTSAVSIGGGSNQIAINSSTWDVSGAGVASGLTGITSSGTISFTGLTGDTDDTVLILNASNQVRTREIDTRVWGTSLVDSTTGSANYVARFTDADTLGIGVLYDNATNVGVGTTTPTALLDVAGNASSSGMLSFRGTTDPKINVLNGEALGIRTSVGGDAGLVERLTVLNGGNVGIGSTTPGALLDVAGTGRFLNTLTASNGFTLTTGALNLTATSGTISLTGMSASSMSFGANNLLVTAGNFNTTSTGINTTAIGATTPSTGAFTTLSSTGATTLGNNSSTVAINSNTWDITTAGVASGLTGITSSGTISFTGLTGDTDDTVLILNASNQVRTREIDTRVWGSTLIDGSGATSRVAYWTDANTVAYDDDFVFDGTNVGIGTTAISTYRLNVNGNLNLVSGFDYHINGVGLNDNASGASGASLIGLYDDSMTYIGGNTTVQGAIKELDTNMGTLAAGTSKWSRVAGNLYPTLGESISATTSGGTVGTFTATGSNLALRAGNAGAGIFTVSNVGGISVAGASTFSNTITATGLGTGTDNTVLILNGSNQVTTDEIDSRVWGTSLVDSTTGSANYVARFTDADTLGIGVLYDNATNVGVGTTTPTALLDIAGSASTSATLAFRGTTDPKIDILNGEALGIRTSVGGDAGLTERLTILNGGNVGISSTTPGARLDVTGTGRFSQTLTASNGFTQTTGALNLTATSGTISLSGMSASSMSFGANNLLVTAGNFNTTSTGINSTAIGATTPSTGAFTTLSSTGATTLGNNSSTVAINSNTWDITTAGVASGLTGITSSGTISFTGLTGDTDDTVLILNSSNQVRTREIDTRVWGSTLVDGSGTANRVAYWTDANTVAADDDLFFNGTNVGIGTTVPTAKLDIVGDASSSGMLSFRGTTDPKINVLNGEAFGIRTSVGGDAGLTERLTILNGGNVGIGSAAPAYKLDVNGDIRIASGSDLYINTTGLNDNASAASGASLIGLYDDSMTYIAANTTVQGAIKELDTNMGTLAAGSSKWTRVAGNLYPTLGESISATTAGGTVATFTSAGTNLALRAGNAGAGFFSVSNTGSISTPGTVTFSGLTANRLVSTDGSSNLTTTISSANVGASISDETGSGLVVFNDGPTFSTSSVTFSGITNDVVTPGSEHFAIVPGGTGNVGIASTSPGAKLDVTGTGRFSSTLTASNGFTQTTGALNLTATSGTISLTGMSASSMNFGGNNLTVTAGNFNTTSTGINTTAIGATTPSTAAFTTLAANSTVTLTGLGTGTDNTVLILNASNQVTTDEIDSRVWGTSLVDGTGTANRVSYWTDADTIAADDDFFFNGTNVGIGTIVPTAKLDIVGSASTSGTLAFRGTTDPKIDVLNGEALGIRTSVGGDAGLTERLTILNGGNVGIASTTPGATLDVTGTGRFSSTLTASNGLTLTTGALNLTSTSGTISLTGMSASSMSFGANNLTVTAGNFNTTSTGINSTAIGATTPSTAAFTTLSSTGATTLGNNSSTVAVNSNTWDVSTAGVASGLTGITSSGTISFTGLTGDTDDTVLILNASNQVRTREIDTRVWGSTLVDGSGATSRVAYWTDANTVAYDDDFVFDGVNIGIGTTAISTYRLNVNGNVNLISGFDYHIDGVGLNDNASPASGASLIGLYDDSMTYIAANTTVQSAIKQLDTNMGTLAAGASKWTRVAGNLYPTLGESISATTSGGTVGTFTSTGTNNSLIAGSTSNYFTVSNVGAIAVPSTAVITGTLTADGSLVANNTFTLGDNGETGSINTSDWDIDATGVMTGISGITTNGGYTQSGSGANTLTGATGISGATTITNTLTSSGGAIALNHNSNFAVNIGTGTTTSTVSIGGGSNQIAINSSTWDITGAGVASGLTGLSSTGTITFGTLTANRLVSTDGSSNLVTTISSANVGLSISDETGSGLVVFNNAPTFSTGSVTFSGITSDVVTPGNEHFAIVPGGTGNVGVGTTTPTALLDVAGNASSSGMLSFRGTTDPKINVLNGEAFGIRTSVGGDAGLTERLTVLNGGNVGIASTTPGATLDVTGTGRFSQTLTASNGFTQTTGALNLTATSGTISLTGMSASSMSFGANNLLVTAGNFNTTSTGINSTAIGATTPSTGAFTTLSSTGATTLGNNSSTVAVNSNTWDVSTAGVASGLTGITSSGTISFTGLTGDTDDTVLILNASNQVRTREIDTRVWGSTLVDGSGTTGHVTYWSDANTLTSEAQLAISRGGTNSTATPTNGGVAYGTGTAYAFTSVGTPDYILKSNGAAAPTWVDPASLGLGNYWSRVAGNLYPALGESISATTSGGIVGTFTSTGTNNALIAGSTSNYFTVSNVGGISVPGAAVFTNTLTSSGGAISLNHNSNFTVNIGTGTTTSAVNIGGGSNQVTINSSTWDITGAGVASGLTGLSSSGTITFGGVTANRLVSTDGSSNLATSISSANVGASITDETGTGLVVFNNGPTFTTGSVTFSGITNDVVTPGSEHFAIVPGGTGNVGIASTSPGAKLDVTGTGRFSSTLTASNGFTQTTGALNLTATSGTISLTGMSASSMSFGANNLLVTAGNFNTTSTGINTTAIGATTPSTAAFTTLAANSTVTLTGLTGDTDDTVLILNSSNQVRTREIDTRVWGSTLVDDNGTAAVNRVAYFLDADTIAGDDDLYFDGVNVGIGTTTISSYRLNVSGNVNLVSGFDYHINGVGLNDNASAASGASLVGLYDDSMTYISGNTTVQAAIKELDTNIGTLAGGSSKWTRVAGNLYPSLGETVSATSSATNATVGTFTATGNNLALRAGNAGAGIFTVSNVGGISVAGASTFSNTITATGLGTGTDNTVLILNGSNQVTTDEIDARVWGTSLIDGTGTANRVAYFTGTSTIASDDDLFFNGTNVGIGTTVPTAKLDIVGDASSSGMLSFRGTTDPKINVLNGEAFGIRTSVGGDAGLTERLTILNGGNVGIGSAAPGATLDVTGTGRFSNTLTANGSLVANNTFTLGDNGETGSINTSDWDIDATGVMTGISGITTNGGYTQSGSGANTLTGATGISGATTITNTLTSSGGAIALNHNSNFAVNIGTGTTTSTVSIGGGSNQIAINSSTWDITGAGVASGLTGITSSGTISFTGLTGDTDDTVLILNGSNEVRTREIDTRVWGSSLVDGSGATSRVTYWTDANTVAYDDDFVFDGVNVGIGTTAISTYRLNVNGNVNLISGFDYHINGVGLNDNASAASGASLIGLYDDSMTYIAANTTVQAAIKELDTNMGTLAGGASKWTRVAGNLYPSLGETISATSSATNATVGTFTATGNNLALRAGNAGAGFFSVNNTGSISTPGTVTFSGVTANRLVSTDGSSNLTTSISSANVGASITDETGSGLVVFNDGPTFSNTSVTFSAIGSDIVTPGSEDFVIAPGGTGNVGIASTSPGAKLDVTGTGRFSSTLTASSGLTLTTGALNLTATSGTISLTGMSASSMDFSSNNLTITAGNFNTTSTGINTTAIGATTPSTAAFTTLAANSTVTLTGLSGDTDDTVLILNSSNQVRTREIDTRVWGSSLVDGTSTTGYVTYWSDANTIAGEQYLNVGRGGLGANMTAGGAGELIYSTSTTAFDTLAAGTSGYILQSNGAGAPSWIPQSTLNYWQRNAGAVAPLEISNDLLVGAAATASARVRLPGLNNQHAWFNLGTGNVGINTTSPAAKLDVLGEIRSTRSESTVGLNVLNPDTPADQNRLNSPAVRFTGVIDNHPSIGTVVREEHTADLVFVPGITGLPEQLQLLFDGSQHFAFSGDGTGRLGIGTSAPVQALHVVGSGYISTNLGVGTTSVAERLNVDGSGTFTGNVAIGTTTNSNRVAIVDTNNTVASVSLTNNTANTIGAGGNVLGVMDLQSTSLTTGNFMNIEVNGLTTGTALNISRSGAGLTTGGELVNLDMGAATAGNGLNVVTTGNYAGTGLLTLTANSSTAGTIAAISANGLTTGTGLAITRSGAGLTTNGELLDLNMGASTAGNGVNITTTGNYTGTGLIVATANTATSGTLAAVSGTGLTTGRALSLTAGGSTALTTGGAILVTGPTGAAALSGAAGGVVNFTASGAYTSANNAGLLNLTAGTATGVVQAITANSLTTGTALLIPHTTSVIANGGSLARITSSSVDTTTTTGALLDLQSTGSTAGTQFLQTYSALNSGIGQSIITNALNTGTAFSLSSSSTALTTGGLIAATLSGNPAASWTGALARFEVTGNDADIDGDALRVGVTTSSTAGSIATALNVTSAGPSGAYVARFNDDGGYATDTSPIVINHDGNLGIGTTNATHKLTLVSAVSSDAMMQTNGTVSLVSWLGTTSAGFGTTTNSSLGFFTNNSAYQMTLTPGGNVGIGTETPSRLLHVQGDMRLTGAFYDGSNSAGSNNFILRSTGSATEWIDPTTLGMISKWQVNLGTVSPHSSTLDVLVGANATSSARMRIPGTNNQHAWFNNGTGNFGIGTTVPAQKLDIVGNLQFSQALMPNGSAGTAGYMLQSQGAGAAPTWVDPSVIAGTNFWQVNSAAMSPINNTWDILLGNHATASASIRLTATSGQHNWINNGAGNFGLGTTNPAEAFELFRNQNTGTVARITNSNTGTLAVSAFQVASNTERGGFAATSSNYVLAHLANRIFVTSELGSGLAFAANAGSGMIQMYTGGVATGNERFRIASNGNIGLGTTTTSNALINLPANTAADGGFNIGADVSLYRSAANTLRIGDSDHLVMANGTTGNIAVGTTTATNARIYAQTSASAATALYGMVSSTGANTRAIYGLATGGSGGTYGIWGETGSTSGTGVYGVANAGTGTTYGVFGQTGSTSGTGVYGVANAGSGTTYGVYGSASSTSGYAIYGSGRGYFSGNLGIGSLSPTQALDVAGNVRFSQALMPNNNAGTSGYLLTSSGAGTAPTWSDPAVIVNQYSQWQLALGALAPNNITNDVLVGSNATASARVRLPGLNNQDAWFMLGTGRVGINTTAPSQTLDVNGNLRVRGNDITDSADATRISLGATTTLTNTTTTLSGTTTLTASSLATLTTAAAVNWGGVTALTFTADNAIINGSDVANGNLVLRGTNNGTKATSYLLLQDDGGNVGIGTTAAANFRLQVNGGVGPTTDATFDLGSSSLRWRNLYISGMSTGGMTVSSLFSSIVTAQFGHSGYTNFSGGIGTGNVDSITSGQRLTSQGNLVNIGSYQGGGMSLTRGGTLAAKVDYLTGDSPDGIAIGELNGTGSADLVVANVNDDDVSVYVNNGNGTFAPKVDYAVGVDPLNVAVMDLNGDGKPDLAVSNSGDDDISVLMNNGNGTFAAKVDYPAGNQPYGIAAGDLNGDGSADIVTVNSLTDNDISVFMNDGAGTFAAKVDYPTATAPRYVSIADFNGDSKADLAVTNSSSNSVSVFINNGNGTFATKVDYTTGTAPLGVAAGDVDGDGDADIVTANSSGTSASVFINTGNGTFVAKADYTTATTPITIALGDVSGDGKPDMVTANSASDSLSVFINNGNGTFAAKADSTTGDVPRGVVLGDLNADGKMDTATTNFNDDDISILLNQSTSLFVADAQTGNVGIGVTNPAAKLVVEGDIRMGSIGTGNGLFVPTNNAYYTLKQSNSSSWPALDTGLELSISSGADRNVYLYNSTGFNMNLMVEGNLGVGTTVPGGKLDVRGGTIEFDPGSGADSTRAFNFNITGSNFGKILIPSGSGGAMAFWTGSANSAVERMRIAAGGNVGIGDGGTAAEQKLTVYDSSNPAISIFETGSGGSRRLRIIANTSNGSMDFRSTYGSGGAYPMAFAFGASSPVMGLGTTGLLHLSGSSAITSNPPFDSTVGSAAVGWKMTLYNDAYAVGVASNTFSVKTGNSGWVSFFSTSNPANNALNSGTGTPDTNAFASFGVGRNNLSGNLGVGTTGVPGAGLDVESSGGAWTTSNWQKAIELNSAAAIKWEDNGTTRHGIGQTTGGLYFIRSDADDNSIAPTYSMSIDNSGNVDIGALAAGATNTVITHSSGTLQTRTIDARVWGSTLVDTSRTLTAGNGLTGGGDLSANRTFTVGTGDGITVNATNVAVNGTVIRTNNSSQNIGVSTNARHRLLIHNPNSGSSATSELTISNNTANEFQIFLGSSTWSGGANLATISNAAGALRIHGSGGGSIFIATSNNVGIGTTSPTQMLDVNGQARVRTIGSGTFSTNMNRTADGTFTTSTSDRRLKTNLQDLDTNTLAKVMSLKPYYFDWYDGSRYGDVGFMAQDVAEIYPSVVFTNDYDGYMGINYDRFAAILTKAIQEQQGQIVSLQNSVAASSLTLTDVGSVVIGDSGSDYAVTPVGGGSALTKIIGVAQAVIGKLYAGLVSTKDLAVSGSGNIASLTVNSLKVGSQSLQAYIESVVNNMQLAGSTPLPEGTLVVENLVATGSAELSDVTADSLVLNNNASISGNLTVESDATIAGILNTETVQTQSLQANSTLLGSLLVENDASVLGDASVSGNLDVLGSARLAALESKLADIEHISAVTASLYNATISGTLYANTIANLDGLIANSVQPTLLQQLIGYDPNSTNSAQLLAQITGVNLGETIVLDPSAVEGLTVDSTLLGAHAGFFSQYLQVNGNAAFGGDVLVVGKTTLASGLSLENNTISYVPQMLDECSPEYVDPSWAELDEEELELAMEAHQGMCREHVTLRIQPTGSGVLNLMDGLLIAENGAITIDGQVTFKKSVTIESTLLTDLVSPTSFDRPFQLQVAGIATESGEVKKSRFELIDELGTPVATISAEGVGEFSKVKAQDGLAIGNEGNVTPDGGQIEVSASAGKSSIPSGESQITIISSQITENSLLNLTLLSDSNNQVLYVKDQGEGFAIVGFKNAVMADTRFNWWIIE